jgi:2-oxoglutarate ferredoxin oxidoreductase subunit delta
MEQQTVAASRKERKVKGKVAVNIQKCKGCELCTLACKEGVLSLSTHINNKGYRYIVADIDLCTGCVNCALVCPDAVISVYRTPLKKKVADIPLAKEELLTDSSPSK